MDSMISSGATGYDSKIFEHVKNFYDTQAWLPKNGVIVNAQAFNALDKSTQDAVLKAAAEAETRGWKISQEKTGWYVEQLRKNGMNVAPPSAELKTGMSKIGEQMLNEWLQKAGPDAKAVIDAYRKM